MVLDKLKESIKGKFEEIKTQRAEQRAFNNISRKKAIQAGRIERANQSKRLAIEKEKFLAKQELEKFKAQRKPRTAPKFNSVNATSLFGSGPQGSPGFNPITGGSSSFSSKKKKGRFSVI